MADMLATGVAVLELYMSAEIDGPRELGTAVSAGELRQVSMLLVSDQVRMAGGQVLDE